MFVILRILHVTASVHWVRAAKSPARELSVPPLSRTQLQRPRHGIATTCTDVSAKSQETGTRRLFVPARSFVGKAMHLKSTKRLVAVFDFTDLLQVCKGPALHVSVGRGEHECHDERDKRRWFATYANELSISKSLTTF